MRAVREAVGNPTLDTTDTRLHDLAGYLEHPLSERLQDLVEANSIAHRVIDLVQRTQRAEDLAQECRRQLRARDRQVDRLQDEVAALKRRLERSQP